MSGICGMCGIDGVDKAVLKRMTNTMVHRGPEGESYLFDGPIGLGCRELRPKEGQPIQNEDKSISLTADGEIYNQRTLRKELEKRGHRYGTSSDLESIVHAYEEYGKSFLEKLNGVFGLALWDSNKKTLFLARDKIGVKSMHYAIQDGNLFFGSEIKAVIENPDVKRILDVEALHHYLTYGYIPSPFTIFRGIRKLPPSHALIFENGSGNVFEYWDVKYPSKPSLDESYFLVKIRETLTESVRKRVSHGGKVGAFVSGGLDSSIVLALMSKFCSEIKTFSIGFEESSFSELSYARLMAEKFGTDHHELILRPDVFKIVPDLVRYYDEPFADSSAIPTFMVSRMAKEHVDVCLAGDGGDETFGGYDRYAACIVADYYNIIPSPIRAGIRTFVERIPVSTADKSFVKMGKRFVDSASLPREDRYLRLITIFTNEQKKKLYKPEIGKRLSGMDSLNLLKEYYRKSGANDFIGKTQYVDLKTYLADDGCVKVDRANMANSLGIRVPFLDVDVVEFAATIPTKFKVRGMKLKYILKRSMKGILPDEILNRKKHGFGIPLGTWFKGELRGLPEDILLSKDTRLKRYLDPESIRNLLNEHDKGVMDHSHRIWALLFFELWHRHYIDREKIKL